jgi:transposase-like protein
MDNQLTILKRDARGRVRSTAEARAEAVAEYRRSGLSASAFAKMAGIAPNTFWNWLHGCGLTQKRGSSKAASPPPTRFVQVAAPASAWWCDRGGGR